MLALGLLGEVAPGNQVLGGSGEPCIVKVIIVILLLVHPRPSYIYLYLVVLCPTYMMVGIIDNEDNYHCSNHICKKFLQISFEKKKII